ncbi:MAG: hypothetical protein AB1942_23490 [Pseudomonadota bacterium]
MGREERIYEEAAALWRQLYGEPPPAHLGGSEIIGMIVGGLDERDYARLATPHLRPSNITFPR